MTRTSKRALRPAFDDLEGRQLLSAMLPGNSTSPSAPAISPPAPHQSDLSVTLTTDRKFYLVGQSVYLTLTEKNTSTHDVQVTIPSVGSFSITRNGATVWKSDTGPVPLSIILETLKPGESIMQKSKWDGVPNVGPPTVPTGTYVAHSEQFPSATATFHIFNIHEVPVPVA